MPTPKPVAIPVLRPPDPPTEVLTPPPAPAMVAPEFRPERGPETGFFASVGRAVVGCLGLFLVLIATMILAWLFLFNTPPDDAAPPPATRKTEAPGGG